MEAGRHLWFTTAPLPISDPKQLPVFDEGLKIEYARKRLAKKQKHVAKARGAAGYQ